MRERERERNFSDPRNVLARNHKAIEPKIKAARVSTNQKTRHTHTHTHTHTKKKRRQKRTISPSVGIEHTA